MLSRYSSEFLQTFSDSFKPQDFTNTTEIMSSIEKSESLKFDKIPQIILQGKNPTSDLQQEKQLSEDPFDNYLQSFEQSIPKPKFILKFLTKIAKSNQGFYIKSAGKIKHTLIFLLRQCILSSKITEVQEILTKSLQTLENKSFFLLELLISIFHHILTLHQNVKIELLGPFMDLFLKSKCTQLQNLIFTNIFLKLPDIPDILLLDFFKNTISSLSESSLKSKEQLESICEMMTIKLDSKEKLKEDYQNYNFGTEKMIKDLKCFSLKGGAKKKNNKNIKELPKTKGQRVVKSPSKRRKIDESEEVKEKGFSQEILKKLSSPRKRSASAGDKKIIKEVKTNIKEKAQVKGRSKSLDKKKNVKFDLDSISVKLFDKRTIVSKTSTVAVSKPGKGILKTKTIQKGKTTPNKR
ncbi:hypothetical protein SteCoe_21043 [Stentor coeruleus]|uniref:Uncharacterized protein n=1 Tax=Stentor coeruleus TaxID=5963 RepID=A0A1R2BQD2_9CILI|nr:hypothetical protein SteCoe_21043 [Stentor coeruleus]